MGDIADMLLEGLLCEGCGVLLISEGGGALRLPFALRSLRRR